MGKKTDFDYPIHIRKAIYTTNAVISLNSVIRRVIKMQCIPNGRFSV